MVAKALVLDGDLEEADNFLRPHEQRAKARGHRSAQARLGYAHGRLLGAMNDIAGARGVFNESLDHLEGLPLRFDTARVNFAYGRHRVACHSIRSTGQVRRDCEFKTLKAEGFWEQSFGA
jgi:hypothetical protein